MITKKEYDMMVTILNGLMDVSRSDENHPFAVVMDSIAPFIEEYESVNLPPPYGNKL